MRRIVVALVASASFGWSAQIVLAQGTLRIAMTASDIPITTGMPNNGFEGMRFFGCPVFESLVLWDLSRADQPADLRPGLATAWKQDTSDPATWIFTLRRGHGQVNSHKQLRTRKCRDFAADRQPQPVRTSLGPRGDKRFNDLGIGRHQIEALRQRFDVFKARWTDRVAT